MSRKHVKQYFMLLMAVGVIAVALSGGGTFASFTAETANPGNTFATGTLYLHDSVNGKTECTSESAPNNSNVPASVGGANPGDNCDILFTVPSSQFATNGLVDAAPAFTTDGSNSSSGPASNTPATLTLTTGLTHSIPSGAVIELTDLSNGNADTGLSVTSDEPAGATSIPVTGTLSNFNNFSSGFNLKTLYVTSIAVRGWDGVTGGNNLGLMFGIASGSEVEITNGTNHSDICSSTGASAGATSVPVSGCTLLHQYAANDYVESPGPFIAHLTLRNAGTIDGKDLYMALNGTSGTKCVVTGGITATLCDHLDVSVTETNNSFTGTIDYATGDVSGAVGCAYGTLGTNGCNPDNANFPLSGIGDYATPANWDQLTLASGKGTNNTRDLLGLDSTVNHPTGSGYANPAPGSLSGGARYFLVEIWPGDLTNNDQGASTTFDLVWHMDQA